MRTVFYELTTDRVMNLKIDRKFVIIWIFGNFLENSFGGGCSHQKKTLNESFKSFEENL